MLVASVASNPTMWVNTFVGFAVCFSRARIFQLKTEKNPWGMPVWAWAILGLVIGLLGAVLALVATRKSAIEKARIR